MALVIAISALRNAISAQRNALLFKCVTSVTLQFA